MLDSLSSAARLWLFATDRSLGRDEAPQLLGTLRPFLDTWRSHGRTVPAEATVLERRVLAIAAEIDSQALNAGVSGCGIDAMMQAVRHTLADRALRQLDALTVIYRASDTWAAVSRSTFRTLAARGEVNAETLVLDLTLDTLGDLRTHGLARRAGQTWHARAFSLAAPAAS